MVNMKFPKQAKFALIGFLITLTIAFRYPIIPHHYGSDAYLIHGMAHSISINKFAAWIIHPGSVYGLYPLSYPTGIPFILSAVSQCTDLSIESIILILSMIFGLLGAFGAFMMVSEINDSFLLKFISAFAFSLAPVFLRFTYWTMSTRGPFIVFLPFLLFILMRCINQRHKKRYISLGIILIFLMPTLHHFALLLPIVISALFTTLLISFVISNAQKKLISDRDISLVASPILLTIFFVLFYLQAHEFSLYAPKLELFKSYIIPGNEPYVIILNLCVLYGLYYGAIIVFSVIGFSLLILKINRNSTELFLLILLIFFISFLLDSTYLSFFILPITIPFIGLGLIEVFRNINNSKFVSLSIFLAVLLLSISFTNIAQNQVLDEKFAEESGFSQWADDKTYNSALYLKTIENNGSLISNDFYLHRRIWAISGIPVMPFEGFELFFFDSSIDSRFHIERIPISEVYLEHYDQIWQIDLEKSKISKNEPYWVINYECNDVKTNLSKFRVNFAIENNHFPERYGSSRHYYNLQDSRFFISIHKTKYNVYDNGFETIWFLY